MMPSSGTENMERKNNKMIQKVKSRKSTKLLTSLKLVQSAVHTTSTSCFNNITQWAGCNITTKVVVKLLKKFDDII